MGLSNVPNVDTTTTANITDTTAKRFVSDTEKTAITHSNRSVLDLITESFTTALKTAYDSTVTWISTNGANVLSHLSSTSNPHSVTKAQVGLSNVDNTSDVNKPVSTAQGTAIGLKEDSLNKSTLTSESTSTTKFPVWSAIVSYFSASQIRSILGITTLSGSNTGDQDLSGLMVKANNLSDLINPATARTNLGLGTLSTQNGTFTDKYDASNPSGYQTASNVTNSIASVIQTKKSFLTVTQASTIVTPTVLTGHTFTIPAGKTAQIQSIIIFTSAVTTTGILHGIRVANPSGANANAIGSVYNSVNLASTALANCLHDGDAFNVAQNTNAIVQIIGTATTAGNNASILNANIFNQSTNTILTVTIEFASEIATSAVTCQVGTGATCIII